VFSLSMLSGYKVTRVWWGRLKRLASSIYGDEIFDGRAGNSERLETRRSGKISTGVKI
jgi:hypothetical protein